MLNILNRLAASLIVASFGALNSAADTPPQPSIESYGSLPSTEDVALSPDGKSIAMVIRRGEDTGIVKIDLESGTSFLVGSIGDMKMNSLHFLNSETLIIRLSKTRKAFGYRGKFEASGSVAVNMTSGKIIGLLANTKGLHPAQSGLGRIVGYNPSADHIYMPAHMKTSSTTTYDLLRVSPHTGRGKRIARGSDDTIGWLVNSDGAVLAREDLDDNKDIYTIKTKRSGKWETVFKAEDQARIPFSLMGVMPDQSGLVISIEGDQYDSFYKLDWAGNRSRLSLGLSDKNIEHIFRDANRVIQGVRYSGVQPSYHFLDQDLNASVKAFTQRFGAASAEIVSHDDNWNRVVYKVFDGATSGSYILHDRTTDDIQSLGQAYSDIPQEAIGSVSVVEYKAQDGTPIEALVTWPSGSTEADRKNLPLILMPHGGPASYDSLRFDWMAQYFANRGYIVLQPNFRGSDGYGGAFREAGHGQWGTGMQDDITNGLDVMVSSGFVDPSRVCIVGASYGGYAALAGGAFTPDKYACVVAIAPVADLRGFIRWVEKRAGKNASSVDYWNDSIGDPRSERGKLENASPSKSASSFQAPVLLIHGDDDTVVPIEQSFTMNKALKAAGKSVKLVKLDGGDHWLAERETRIQTLTEMDKFVSKHLK